MKKLFILSLGILCSVSSFGQIIFKTESKDVTVLVNNQVVVENWTVSPEKKPDIFEAECTNRKNKVTFKAEKDSIIFNISAGKTIDFVIQNSKNEQAYTQIKGIKPNANFTKKYIKRYNGKTIVEIPEVSELVNILMVLNKDAEKEGNMFDTKIEYYNEVKSYFKPYLDHPALDTINKYITDLQYNEELKTSFFSNQSYTYYYALKMNACAYVYDKKGKIRNNGFVKEYAKGWNSFDPMKDAAIFEDFAKKSNFREFYKNHKTYYDDLIKTYNQLNPISKMQNWLDQKFGFGYGSYVVYFSPFVYGAHSTQNIQSNGFTQSFMFIAKAEMDKAYSNVMNELLESRGVFTEIDHNYVNPISDKFLDRINKSFSNREKWAKGEVTSMYNNPYAVFNEYMTWAVYSMYVNDNYLQKDLEEYLPKVEKQMEDRRGYIAFKKFNRTLLEKYQKNPSITMNDLFEFILNWADSENK
jgi:hypothetical protein